MARYSKTIFDYYALFPLPDGESAGIRLIQGRFLGGRFLDPAAGAELD